MALNHCYLLVSALFLLVCAQTATSIRCYVCTTKEDGKKCEDPFNKTESLLATCDIPTSICVKQILPALGKYPESTYRACVEEDYCKNYHGHSMHCSTCKVDQCNSSLGVSAPIGVLCLLSLYYFLNYLTRQHFQL